MNIALKCIFLRDYCSKFFQKLKFPYPKFRMTAMIELLLYYLHITFNENRHIPSKVIRVDSKTGRHLASNYKINFTLGNQPRNETGAPSY